MVERTWISWFKLPSPRNPTLYGVTHCCFPFGTESTTQKYWPRPEDGGVEELHGNPAIGVALEPKRGRPPLQLKCRHQWEKCDKKAYCFFNFRYLVFFLGAIINNNIDDQGLRASLNLVFVNQFKCVTRKKLRAFVLKVVISGPHLAFLWT